MMGSVRRDRRPCEVSSCMVGHYVVLLSLLDGHGRRACGGGLGSAGGQGRRGASGAGLRGQRACGRGGGLGSGEIDNFGYLAAADDVGRTEEG